eukprot:6339599-Alexandrium_andersonii.AAC.1
MSPQPALVSPLTLGTVACPLNASACKRICQSSQGLVPLQPLPKRVTLQPLPKRVAAVFDVANA